MVLEMLQADHFSGMSSFLIVVVVGLGTDSTIMIDISVSQWLALTPHQITQDTLNLTKETVDAFPIEKQYIIPAAE